MSDWLEELGRLDSEAHRRQFVGPAVIYGAGKIGKTVLAVLRKKGVQTVAFLDAFSSAQAIDGVPVRRVDDASVSRSVSVIVAVFNREKNARFSEIQARLSAAGFSHVLSFEQFYLSCSEDFCETFFWLADPRFLIERANEVRAADALWADAPSRALFRNQVGFRLTADERFRLDEFIADRQYLPKDVPLTPPPYRFVDVGAFDGDTLSAMRAFGACFESVWAFEPDMKNFRLLVERVKREGPFSRQTVLFPCGVGRTCGAVAFCADGAESSRASGLENNGTAGGQTLVPVVALDDVLHGFEPNYIKLDVEGYEAEALCGMRGTVESCRPMLAVSAYHRPEDLFALPLMLSRWNYPADFYLRTHMEHALETVLYAIPRAR